MTVVPPTRQDPVARAASQVVGGPAGARIGAGRHGWWTATRVLVVLSMAMIALGVVQKEHCRAQGWTSPDQFFHACYSDLPADYEGSGLASGVQPYLESVQGSFLSEPVLTGTLMYAVAALVPGDTPAGQDRWFFDLSALLIAAALAATVALTAAMAGRRRWDAAHVALAPVLVLAALVSFELVGVALITAGLWAWSRCYPVVAGVMLALAGCVTPLPAVLVWFAITILAVRAGRSDHSWRLAWGAVAMWIAVNLPVILMSAPGWAAGARGWWSQGAGYGSPWMLLNSFSTPGATLITVLALAGLAVVAVGVTMLTLSAARRPRVAQVAFLLVAGGLLANKSFPVQASLILLPLIALALPRWRDHLIWAGAEAIYFAGVWLYIAGLTRGDHGLPAGFYYSLLVIRVLAVVWLMVVVVRDVLRPGHDLVRQPPTDAAATDVVAEVDDPIGGALDGAPDAVIVRFA